MGRAERGDVVGRLVLAVARARPEGVPRLVLAACRVAFPGARADLLVRERKAWVALGRAPSSAPELELAGGPAAPRQKRVLPREPQALELGERRELAGDAALHALGFQWRLVAPLRLPEPRGLLSVARDAAFSEADARLLGGLARAAERALATRSRLERSRQALRTARLVQKLIAGVNRSLLLEDILRSAATLAREEVPFARAMLVVATPESRDITVLRLDDSDQFRRFEVERLAGRARTQRLAAALREPRIVADLREVAAPDPWQGRLLEAGLTCELSLPLLARRRFVGSFVIAAREPGSLQPHHLALLRHLSRPLGGAIEKARLFREASERSRQMTALYEVGQALNSPLDTAGVTERVLSILHETFRFQHSAVLTLEPDSEGDWLVMQASRGYSLRPDETFRMRVADRGVTSRAVRTGRLVYVPDVRRDPHYVQGVERGRSEVAVPLQVGGRVVGVLDVESTRVAGFSTEDLDTLKLFSTQVALALARARDFDEIRRQAMTDGLTGLLNQRYFREKVEREISRSQQTGRPFVLALLDIDDFKRVNDEQGHVAGDQAITTLGGILRARVRPIDAAARFGGDEFALILSEMDEAAGLSVVQELLDELRGTVSEGVLRLTVSVGVVEWRPEMTALRDVVGAADAALYRAKSDGKDRAVVASLGAPAPGGQPA